MVAEYPDHGFVGLKLELNGSPANERLMREHRPIIIPNVAEATELGNNPSHTPKTGPEKYDYLPMLAEDELLVP